MDEELRQHIRKDASMKNEEVGRGGDLCLKAPSALEEESEPAVRVHNDWDDEVGGNIGVVNDASFNDGGDVP